MALFDENDHHHAARGGGCRAATVAGIWALAVALVVLLVLTFLPTSYVIQQPGPVYNTLGTATSADGDAGAAHLGRGRRDLPDRRHRSTC